MTGGLLNRPGRTNHQPVFSSSVNHPCGVDKDCVPIPELSTNLPPKPSEDVRAYVVEEFILTLRKDFGGLSEQPVS
ncbi:hypothetical protein T265_12256 [Opisthorchis viverrini]|uniref:Uncharacterized protein n=1 Tax=Opisthorchis viverrini TaxID=6198 RepID=A0A074YUW3_OPIVI|nr:hypothetical protein T265_12256 [Opisthorchis viverrini]KER18493.1 hypothetical protein T265_12256 [Opisthorchis viverrini]